MAEQRMHLAHLEAGLLEDEWKEESNPMPLAAVQVQHQYLEAQSGEGRVCVPHTLRGPTNYAHIKYAQKNRVCATEFFFCQWQLLP